MSPEGNIIAGVVEVLISPHNFVIPCAFLLTKPCSNNISEYNALLIGMQLAEEIESKISKHMAIQSSLSLGSRGVRSLK